MARQLGNTHHRDIKIICNLRNLTACLTIHGFESYTRVESAEGKPVKQLVPNVPVQFMPGVNESESGYTVAYVSDTANNRKLIAHLIAEGQISCDSPLFEPVREAVEKPVEVPGAADEAEVNRLMELTKAELLAMLSSMGRTVPKDATKASIVEAITGSAAT